MKLFLAFFIAVSALQTHARHCTREPCAPSIEQLATDLRTDFCNSIVTEPTPSITATNGSRVATNELTANATARQEGPSVEIFPPEGEEGPSVEITPPEGEEGPSVEITPPDEDQVAGYLDALFARLAEGFGTSDLVQEVSGDSITVSRRCSFLNIDKNCDSVVDRTEFDTFVTKAVCAATCIDRSTVATCNDVPTLQVVERRRRPSGSGGRRGQGGRGRRPGRFGPGSG